MKYFIVLTFIFMSVLFVSCDYFARYEYTVVNETSSNIVIKTIINPYNSMISYTDSVYTIKSGEKLTFRQDLGATGKITPIDFYTQEDTIPPVSKFDIYVRDTIQNKLRLHKYWEYSAVTLVGIYKLKVTDSLLEGF